MGAEKSDSPTPLLPAALRNVGIQEVALETGEKSENAPRQLSRNSRNSKQSSRRSGEPVGELPTLPRDIEAGVPLPGQRHDSVTEQVFTYESKEEEALVTSHALQILVSLPSDYGLC
jgi:hypothetical protein